MSLTFSQGLTDIDSLVLAVRDNESKKLIAESISAYRGGALRSAIVSTWIAVTYDIIGKARELSHLGDNASTALIDDLDDAIRNNNQNKKQKIENSLLATALESLQILAAHEHEGLVRLQNDRNLCAHPAFVETDELYQPTPELVRTHITHALKHLLINPPLQGKSAMAHVHTDLLRDSFPLDHESIKKFILTKYLNRANDSMIKNLITSLLSAPFGVESAKYIDKRNLLALTLHIIAEAKPGIYEETAKNYISRKFEDIDDKLLLSISAFIKLDTRVWEWLQESTRIRFIRLFTNADYKTLEDHSAFDACTIAALDGILVDKFKLAKPDEMIRIISQKPRREFTDRAIVIFNQSSDFRTAEQRGYGLIVPLASFMNDDQLKSMLTSASKNLQIYAAAKMPEIFVSVFDSSQSDLCDKLKHWQDFCKEMGRIYEEDSYYTYPKLREKLEAANGTMFQILVKAVDN